MNVLLTEYIYVKKILLNNEKDVTIEIIGHISSFSIYTAKMP